MSNRKDVDDLVSALLGPSGSSSALPPRSSTPNVAGPSHGHPAVQRLPSGSTVGGSRPGTPSSAVAGYGPSGRISRMSERDHVDGHGMDGPPSNAGPSILAALSAQPDLVDGELELFEIPPKVNLNPFI